MAPSQGLRELLVKHCSSVARGKPPPPLLTNSSYPDSQASGPNPGQNGPRSEHRSLAYMAGKPRHFACQAPPPRRMGSRPSHVGTSWRGWSSRGVELGRGMPFVGTHWSGSRKRRLFAKKSRKNPDCVCTPSRAPNPNECFLRSSRLLVRGDDGGDRCWRRFVSHRFLQSPPGRVTFRVCHFLHPPG